MFCNRCPIKNQFPQQQVIVGTGRNLQVEAEKEKVSNGQSRRREAREQQRSRAQWTKTDRKTGSPSLNPEGEDINSVCRENGTQSAGAWNRKNEEAANSSPKIAAWEALISLLLSDHLIVTSTSIHKSSDKFRADALGIIGSGQLVILRRESPESYFCF